MTLFLSDLHLGRGTAAEQRAAEADALALLRAHERQIVDEGGTLVLAGDVFDQFIEYKHLVPKGWVRLLGLLADWSDRGAAILYVVGNRDQWHLDYFRRELGIETVRGPLVREFDGVRTYIAHGDGIAPNERLYRGLRPLLQSSLMARLYRMSLPGDSAFSFARWVARRFGSGGLSDEPTVAGLRAHAERVLAETDAELVVLGHCHRAACIHSPGGTYLNPGYWFADRTFGRLDEAGAVLYRWTGTHAELPSAPPALAL